MFKLFVLAALVAAASAVGYGGYGGHGYGGLGYGGLGLGHGGYGAAVVGVVADYRYNGPIVGPNPLKTAIVATPVHTSIPVVKNIVSSSPVVAVGHGGHTSHVIGETQTVNTVVSSVPAVKNVALPTVVGHSTYGHGYGY